MTDHDAKARELLGLTEPGVKLYGLAATAYAAAEEKAVAIAAALRSAEESGRTKWVRCAEKLPELGAWVLGVRAGFVTVYLYDEDGWNSSSASPIRKPEFWPTHWMPLPEPAESPP